MIVGVIGLGRMGGPMAVNLIKRGEPVIGFDISGPQCDAAKAAGVRIVDSPAAVAADALVLLTSLPGPDAVEQVMLGDDGVLSAVAAGAVVVETSTIGPELSRRISAEFVARGAAYLDAPISGGEAGARAGTLTMMVGGDADAFARARPVLEMVAKDIHHLGPVGAGNAMKLVVQLVVMTYFAAFQEAVALGEKLGLSVEQMLDVLGTSSAEAPSMKPRYAMLRGDDLAPRFEVKSALKDLSLVAQAAAQAGVPALISGAARDAFAGAAEAGYADADLGALFRYLSGRR